MRVMEINSQRDDLIIMDQEFASEIDFVQGVNQGQSGRLPKGHLELEPAPRKIRVRLITWIWAQCHCGLQGLRQ